MPVRHKVPTHLDTPDGVGKFTVRQLTVVGGVVFFVAAPIMQATPPVGPPLTDLVQFAIPSIGKYLPSGQVPIAPLVAAAIPIGLAVGASWPISPPPEHGFKALTSYLKVRGLHGPAAVSDTLGPITVDGKIARSRNMLRAVWELPAANLRLADQSEVDVKRDLWAQFLNGLTCPIQTLVRARPVDAAELLDGMRAHPETAGWLRAQLVGKRASERRRFLAIAAENETKLDHYAGLIGTALQRLGLPPGRIRRLEGEDLAEVLQDSWTTRPARRGKALGPHGAWTVGAHDLQSDGLWHTTLALAKWSRTVGDDSLAPLTDGAFAVDLAEHITALDNDKVLDQLDHHAMKLRNTSRSREREVALEDLSSLIDSVERGEQRVFEVAVYLHLAHKDRAKLAKEREQIKQVVREGGARAAELTWEQPEALIAAGAPLADHRLIHRTHRVDTDSVARLYPWSAAELAIQGGWPIGETLDSHRPVVWTPFARPRVSNPHLVVYGASGGGKGFFVKVDSARGLDAGGLDEVFVVDQADEEEDGEYGRFARYIGADHRYIRTVDDIPSETAHVRGSTVWNIALLPIEDRPAALVAIVDAVRGRTALLRVRLPRRPRVRMVIDEIWSFAKDRASSRAIELGVRTWRHHGIGGVFMTQRPTDSLETEVMRIIQAQAASQWYGPLLPAEVTDVSKRLHWTDPETARIRLLTPGQALFVVGPWRVVFEVQASPEEFDMAHTDGGGTNVHHPDLGRADGVLEHAAPSNGRVDSDADRLEVVV